MRQPLFPIYLYYQFGIRLQDTSCFLLYFLKISFELIFLVWSLYIIMLSSCQ